MDDRIPSPLPTRYTRACLLFGTVLAGSLPPCLAVGLLSPTVLDLGLLRGVILIVPAAVAGGLALVATYYLNHAGRVPDLRPPPTRVAGAALTLFVLGTVTLALPAALFAALPAGAVVRPLPAHDARLEVLRQRALRHTDAGVRASSARMLYLVSGETAPYRDASRTVVDFSPSPAERRQVSFRRWIASRPGHTPRERRLLASTSLALVALVLAGLPLVAALGRRNRPEVGP